MRIPGYTADAAVFGSQGYFAQAAAGSVGAGGEVIPQLCACSPCLHLPQGRVCLTIPVIHKRVCVNVPSLGSWKVCGCLRFGWPPVSVSLRRC